jgi:hypothetical protein
MRLKLFFTAGLVLLLSTLASSNECARYSHKCEAGVTSPAKPAPRAVTADTESSTLVINKLLYI